GQIPEPYLYEIPEPGEHFEYVVVDHCDKKTTSAKGDFMEYLDVVKRFNKKIDLAII
ncbi:741_t:CDS:1, partial [Racocetra fulgida]